MARDTGKVIVASEVEKYLHGMEYPAFRNNLFDHAVEHGAPDEVLNALRQLPDEMFDSDIEVMETLIKIE